MSSWSETAAAPLPRGRHKLPREQVRGSQRARLLRAMLDCVSERGYAATTIADVVAVARVSRNAFYELFENKQTCFLEACDEVSTEMLAELYALEEMATWTAALREGVDRYLRSWRDRPGFAVAYLIELPAAGRAALEQRDRSHARFTALFDALATRARSEQPELPPLPPLATRFLVPAITELVAQEIRAGRLDRLVDLGDQISFLIVKTLADDETARGSAAR